MPDELTEQFSLVICDGPPGTTRGGRMGLLPLLGPRLPPGAVILVDDILREGESADAGAMAKAVRRGRLTVEMTPDGNCVIVKVNAPLG